MPCEPDLHLTFGIFSQLLPVLSAVSPISEDANSGAVVTFAVLDDVINAAERPAVRCHMSLITGLEIYDVHVKEAKVTNLVNL